MVASVLLSTLSVSKMSAVVFHPPVSTTLQIYVTLSCGKSAELSPQLRLCTPALLKEKKRVHYKVPTYKKADKINQNILNYKDNQRHIFRYKALDRIYQEIAKEVLQGQNLLPFDGIILKKDGINLYLNVYKADPYEWVNFKTKKYKDFRGENFIVIQAEIEGTELLPVFQRLKIHIALLRELRQGVKVKKAVKVAKQKAKKL